MTVSEASPPAVDHCPEPRQGSWSWVVGNGRVVATSTGPPGQSQPNATINLTQHVRG
jgi:hypothetical protein